MHEPVALMRINHAEKDTTHRHAPHDPVRLNVVANILCVIVGPSEHVEITKRNKSRRLCDVSVPEKRDTVSSVLELRAEVAPDRIYSLSNLRRTNRRKNKSKHVKTIIIPTPCVSTSNDCRLKTTVDARIFLHFRSNQRTLLPV